MATDTVEQLRGDIDSGRTRDKVTGSDPAAAPLGTDEEAAGTPVNAAVVSLVRSQEISDPPRAREDGGVGFFVGTVCVVAAMLITAAIVLLR